MANMNPMAGKTPEERKAISAKGVATRRANKEAREAEHLRRRAYCAGLEARIKQIEEKLSRLQRMETASADPAMLPFGRLLFKEEVIEAAIPYGEMSGVYFLIDRNEIVYVGQSANVYSRIPAHIDKKFDRYAFIPCPVEMLDRVESLYIHVFSPRLNGERVNGLKAAPISFDRLFAADASPA